MAASGSHPPASSFAFVDFESSSSGDEVEAGEDGPVSAPPPDKLDVVPNAQPPRPLSMAPVDPAARVRPDVTRNRASVHVLTAEPTSLVGGAARAPPTQRQESRFVYDADDGCQCYLSFIKVRSMRGACCDRPTLNMWLQWLPLCVGVCV